MKYTYILRELRWPSKCQIFLCILGNVKRECQRLRVWCDARWSRALNFGGEINSFIANGRNCLRCGGEREKEGCEYDKRFLILSLALYLPASAVRFMNISTFFPVAATFQAHQALPFRMLLNYIFYISKWWFHFLGLITSFGRLSSAHANHSFLSLHGWFSWTRDVRLFYFNSAFKPVLRNTSSRPSANWLLLNNYLG